VIAIVQLFADWELRLRLLTTPHQPENLTLETIYVGEICYSLLRTFQAFLTLADAKLSYGTGLLSGKLKSINYGSSCIGREPTQAKAAATAANGDYFPEHCTYRARLV